MYFVIILRISTYGKCEDRMAFTVEIGVTFPWTLGKIPLT